MYGSVRHILKYLSSSRYRVAARDQAAVKKVQDEAIRRKDTKAASVIVFLVPGLDRATYREAISGGVMSIEAFCRETAQLGHIHHSEVIMATLPGELTLARHQRFRNNTPVFRFEQIRAVFQHLRRIVIHIPEYAAGHFLTALSAREKDWLRNMDRVHINVMNQNIHYMPSESRMDDLRDMAHEVTVTTAHARYCTAANASRYKAPFHKLSVPVTPERYTFRAFSEKENIIVLSPDRNPYREAIVAELRQLENFELQVIRDMTHEAYMELISRAKFSVSFGEGLDGYLVEPVLSGAIGFAVYNDEFFTEEYKQLPTIYSSHEQMISRIKEDIRRYDYGEGFEAYQRGQFGIVAAQYSYRQYKKNIEAFYLKNYTFQ